MNLTPEQLKANYDSLIAIIEENIESPRKEQLIELYDSMAEHMIMAPASGVKHFHLAFAGGYCIHVRNVVNASLLVAKTFKQLGGTIDFTKEELVFSALNHDLGKCGDGVDPYYIPEESEYYRNRYDRVYTRNKKITNMDVTNRALFLLQQAGIKVSENEFLAIYNSDGMFDEKNHYYLKNWDEEKKPRTFLLEILHWGDAMACKAEYSGWKYDNLTNIDPPKEKKSQTK